MILSFFYAEVNMIITRFPPSPTGDLHIGGVRTALYNWLQARKDKGKFILRIEDTDLERSSEKSVAGIIEGIQWLGLDYDEGPYYQTKRFDRYKTLIQQLLDEDKAYYCYCSKERLEALRENQMQNKQKPKYDGHCRHHATSKAEGITPVIRFKNPESGEVEWDDLVHGKISFANQELDDLIIARPDGSPTYNFCVVVDDVDMQMTHVIRGDDHINNTPRQINIFKALNADVPLFGHVGMILGDDGKRLSKRHGASGVLEYRDAGYLPEAIINYLARLGWSHGDQEIFSRQELIELFDITDVNKSASSFNTEKLNWLNQHYLKTLPTEQLVAPLLHQYQLLKIETEDYDISKIIPHYIERAKTLKEMAEQSDWIFNDEISYPEKAAKKAFHTDATHYLTELQNELKNNSDWQNETLEQTINQLVLKLGIGFAKLGMPLRLALTGGKPSPSIGDILVLLGKEKSLQRIDKALYFLSN